MEGNAMRSNYFSKTNTADEFRASSGSHNDVFTRGKWVSCPSCLFSSFPFLAFPSTSHTRGSGLDEMDENECGKDNGQKNT